MFVHLTLSALSLVSILSSLPILITRQGILPNLCHVIESKRAAALDIVVSFLSERIVRTDQDLLSAQQSDSARSFVHSFFQRNYRMKFPNTLPTPGQLDHGQLVLIVLLKCWAGFLEESRVVFRQDFDVCGM